MADRGSAGDFSGIVDLNFPLTVLPAGIVSTSFFAVVVGDMGTVIGAGADWKGAGLFTNNGNIWNNEEAPFSGTVTKSVVCQATLLPTDFATGAQAAAVGPNGGLVKTTFTPTTIVNNQATGVIMTKIQTVLPAVGAPFAGKQFLHREQAGL